MKPFKNNQASIGIGSLIVFIAMLLVASIAANVIIQISNTLQNQASSTGSEALKEVASGVKVVQVNGKANSNNITKLVIYITPMAGSDSIDLSSAHLELSDTSKSVVLYYSSDCFNSSVSSDIFSSLNTSKLGSSYFGILVIRDKDNSCTSSNPVINKDDLVALMVNASACFGNGSASSGIGKNTEVNGAVYPEYGSPGVIDFITPAAYVEQVIDLQ